MATPLPHLLTPGEVAKQLRLSTTQVLRLARAGSIPCLQLPSGEVVFAEADLVSWLGSLRRPVTKKKLPYPDE